MNRIEDQSHGLSNVELNFDEENGDLTLSQDFQGDPDRNNIQLKLQIHLNPTDANTLRNALDGYLGG